MTTGQAVESMNAAMTDPGPVRILSRGPLQRSMRAQVVQIMTIAYSAPAQRPPMRMSAKRSVGLRTTLEVSGTKVEERLAPMLTVVSGGLVEELGRESYVFRMSFFFLSGPGKYFQLRERETKGEKRVYYLPSASETG